MSRTRYACPVVAVVLITALAVSGVKAQSRGLGRINGTIASESGEPIAGAVVKIDVGGDTLEVKSDAAGKWAVSGLGKGQFLAEFSKAGFETRRVRLVIERETLASDPIKILLKKPTA